MRQILNSFKLVMLGTVAAIALASCGGGGGGSGGGAAAPNAPAALTANAGNGQVTMNWTPVAGATSYNVYQGTASGITKATGTKVGSNIIAGPFTVTGLTNGTPYFCVVTAVNATGESGLSVEKSATPSATPPPAAPVNVRETAGVGKATISWDASVGAASYNIYYSTTSGVTKTSGTKLTGAASPQDVTNLTNGTTYFFVVTAVNANGESVTSFEVSATPAATPPPTWSISGAVTGAVQAGVTITLSGAGSATTTTNASGNYTFSGRTDGNYTVTPSLTGYTFSPASMAANVSGAAITGKNFVATAVTVSGLKNVDLVFSNSADLYGMKADGTGKVVLKASTSFDSYDYFSDMAFSADGKYMAYAATCGGNRFIRVMSSNLGNPTDLTTRCSGGAVYSAYSPAFSPDGTKIAYIGTYSTATEHGSFLSIMNADGTNQHRVTPLAIDPTLPGNGYYDPDEGSPSFSADGTLIVFDTCRQGTCYLATIKLDGSNLQMFESCTVSGACDVYHSLTPNEPTVDWSTNTIYYMSSNVNVLNNEWNLYKITLSGAGKVGPLTGSADHNLHRPSVSPDGSKVAFTQIINFSEANIMVLDLSTMAVTTISNPAFSAYSDYPVFVRR